MRTLLSPPNLLTCVRIVLTPFVILALLRGDCRGALSLCLIAGATDLADGFVARRFGWNSRTGEYLDPIADKLLLSSLYLSFGAANIVPWWLVWLVFGRDMLILLLVGIGLTLTSRRDYPPTIWGKLSTLTQIGSSLVFLTSCAYPESGITGVKEAAIYTVALLTTWSGLHYTGKALVSLRELRAAR